MGIIGHDRVLVSLASAHFINGLIKKNGKLSINLVSEEMLPKADAAGSVSGNQADKSELFDWEVGGAGAPILSDSPLSMECTVEDIYNTPNFESFICSIDATYVEERHCGADDKIDCRTLKPILFDFPKLKLMSMNHYDLEENCRMEHLVAFKKVYGQAITEMRRCLSCFFPKMDAEEIQSFIYSFFPFLFGIYPYTAVSPKQREAMARAGVDYRYLSIYELALFEIQKLLHLSE